MFEEFHKTWNPYKSNLSVDCTKKIDNKMDALGERRYPRETEGKKTRSKYLPFKGSWMTYKRRGKNAINFAMKNCFAYLMIKSLKIVLHPLTSQVRHPVNFLLL